MKWRTSLALFLLVLGVGTAVVYASSTGSVTLTDHTDVWITPGNYIDVTASFTLSTYTYGDALSYGYTSRLKGTHYDGDTAVEGYVILEDTYSALPASNCTRNRSTLVPSLPTGFWNEGHTTFYTVNSGDWDIQITVVYYYTEPSGPSVPFASAFLIWNVEPPA